MLACQFRDTRNVHKHFGIVELHPARTVRDVMFPISIPTWEQCIHWHFASHSGAAEPRHDGGLLRFPMQETSLWCTCSEFAPPGGNVSPSMQCCVFQSKNIAKVLFRVADPFLITDDVKVVSMNQHVDLEFIVRPDKRGKTVNVGNHENLSPSRICLANFDWHNEFHTCLMNNFQQPSRAQTLGRGCTYTSPGPSARKN